MPASRSRRVVITGMGLISPLGNQVSGFRASLREGKSGIRPLKLVPTRNLPIKCGGEAVDFSGHINDFGQLEAGQKKAIRKGLKVMCREIQMGVAASQLALQHAAVQLDTLDRERTGVVFGSDYIMTMPDEFQEAVRTCTTPKQEFDFDQWAEKGLPKITPLWLLKYLPNMPACHVAIYNDLRGPNNSITVREASSNLALAEAAWTIERGHADLMLGGATGSRVHPIRTVHIILQEELATDSDDPAQLSRPFDARRTGMVLGEGAATVVLEEFEAAHRRGAEPLAEVVGHGASAVIQRNSVARRRQALTNAMRQALRAADMTPDEIGHVHAHGISTVVGDQHEAQAIADVFGQRPVPVVAAKSYFGNVGAAGGILELIASIDSLRDGTLFATLNYEHPDPECPISVVRGPGVPAGSCVMNLSVTPQGQASALIVRRMD